MLKSILFIKNKHRTIDFVFNWRNNAHSVMNMVEIEFLNRSLLSLHIVLNILTVDEVFDKSGYTKHLIYFPTTLKRNVDKLIKQYCSLRDWMKITSKGQRTASDKKMNPPR